MSDAIRVGIVGIGFGQHVHAPAFRSDPRFRVDAICASNDERAAQVAARLNIARPFGQWRDLVESSDLDAVSISVPPALQPEITISALNSGKAVFCEKPAAASLERALAMRDASIQSKRANMIDFGFPALAEWKKAKRLLDEGAVGRLRHVAVSWHVETYAYRMGLSSWKLRIADGGGALFSFASHTLHYLEWFMGQTERMTATLWSVRDRKGLPDISEDSLVMMNLCFASGAAASVVISAHAPMGSGHRLEFYGDDGALHLFNPTKDYMAGFRLLIGQRSSEAPEDITSRSLEQDPGNDGRIVATTELVGRFADWIITGVPQAPSLEDGLRVQTLLDAALRSHREGRAIDAPSL